MKIAINAISISEGGPLTVAEKLLEQFARQHPEHEYTLLTSASFPAAPLLEQLGVRVCRFGWASRDRAATLAWYARVLPRWLAAQRQDLLFSLTNYLPAWTPVPAALLVQHAGYFCPTFAVGGYPARNPFLWRLTRYWVTRSIRRASRVTVQTRALAEMIGKALPDVSGKITVIPHGPGYLCRREVRQPVPRLVGEPINIVYVTKYGVQKNFGVVFQALRHLRAAAPPVRLHLTLDTRSTGGRRVARHASREGVGDLIMWHGDLRPEAVSDVYRLAHVFVYPSICESFGFPLVEAMSFGLPVIAADTPGNREICGNAALYAPAADARRFAELIERCASSPEQMVAQGRVSRERAAQFDWPVAGRDTLGWLLQGAGWAT